MALAANNNYAPETISSQSLVDFKSNPPKVKSAIEMALELASRNIGYKYGSSEPSSGGMDCSGTIYYLLTKQGIKSVPRSSDSLYQWIKKEGDFYSTNSNDIKTINLSHLKPGDLLFWSGTYQAPGNSYVTHVMMYLGKNTHGDLLMIGSSDGRTYKGRQIYGVSIFDFVLPSSNSKSKFLGYSCIPQLSCERDKKN
jgi:cell wall-associated NlpC family hydrolase